MIELVPDGLCFSFPEVHPDAALKVTFERTFRIPDDERTYPAGTRRQDEAGDLQRNIRYRGLGTGCFKPMRRPPR